MIAMTSLHQICGFLNAQINSNIDVLMDTSTSSVSYQIISHVHTYVYIYIYKHVIKQTKISHRLFCLRPCHVAN